MLPFRVFVRVATAFLFVWLFSVTRADNARGDHRPNVLMIAVDDLRPELNCYGSGHIHSPNIDRLAASGMRFDRAYCSVAVCGASRASLLSGCRPETTQIWDFKTPLRSKMPHVRTLPGHFAANGYQTAFLGKIYHSASDDKESWTIPTNQWAPRDKKLGKGYLHTPYHKRTAHPSIPGLKNGPSTENGGDVADNAYTDGHNAERAVKMLERFAKTEQPFFLAVGFLKPHLPFNAPGRYWDLYDRDAIEIPSREKMKGSLPWARSTWGELKNYPDIDRDQTSLDDETTRRLIHGYYAATSYTDAQVGKLLNALENLRLEQNTIVVLWGDHGWYVGDYGEWCKHSNYEVATRVPLIFRVPPSVLASAKPGSSLQLAELLDIYPTLCDLTGLETPSHVHGHSLKRLLLDPTDPWREAAISQYVKTEVIHPTNPASGNGKKKPIRSPNLGTSVRTQRYRYTRWISRKTGELRGEELVDLKNDPQSTLNVVSLPEHSKALIQLRELAEQSATGIAPPP